MELSDTTNTVIITCFVFSCIVVVVWFVWGMLKALSGSSTKPKSKHSNAVVSDVQVYEPKPISPTCEAPQPLSTDFVNYHRHEMREARNHRDNDSGLTTAVITAAIVSDIHDAAPMSGSDWDGSRPSISNDSDSSSESSGGGGGGDD